MGFWDVESGPGVKFANPGDAVTGKLLRPYVLRDTTEMNSDRPKLDSRGQVVQMAVIELETIPGGEEVTVYADKFGQRKAIGQAIRDSGAADMEVGGILFLQFTNESPSDKGAPLKNWVAKWTPPNSAATWGADPNELVNAARASQQAHAAAYAAPTPPVVQAPPQAVQTPTSTAPSAPAQAVNGRNTTPEQDFAKIKELVGYNLQPAMIQQAVPHLSIEAISALINVVKAQG